MKGIAHCPRHPDVAGRAETQLLEEPTGGSVSQAGLGDHGSHGGMAKRPAQQGLDRLRCIPPPPVRGQHVISDLHEAVVRRPLEAAGPDEDARARTFVGGPMDCTRRVR